MKEIRCRFVGQNAARFFSALKTCGISLHAISTEEKNVCFSVDKKQLRKTVEIANELCYTMEVLTDDRKNRRMRFTRTVCAVAALALMFGIPAFTWSKIGKIEITGETVYSQEIREKLDFLGVKVGTAKTSVDLSSLSDELSDLQGISRVQTAFFGTVLRVSVRDSVMPDDRMDLSAGRAITAACDAVVTKIAVTVGTPRIGVGDIVVKGQLLVEGVEGEGEERREVTPRAVIYGETWSTSYLDFFEEDEQFFRTGNVTRRVEITVGQYNVYVDGRGDPYTYSETETRNRTLTNVVPIHIKETFYYETEAVAVTHDYAAERETLEETVIKKARLSSPLGTVRDEFVVTTNESGFIRIRGVVAIETVISNSIL